MKAYHITRQDNLKSIFKNGLEPRVGERSKKVGGKDPAIYLFPTYYDCEDAAAGWLGLEFHEGEPLTILEVDIEDYNESVVDWEVVVKEKIPSENIDILYYNV